MSIEIAELRTQFRNQLLMTKNTFEKLNRFTEVNNLESTLFLTKEELINKEFENHLKLLTEKTTLDEIRKLLLSYYNWINHETIKTDVLAPKLTNRTFLVAWTIVSFPQFVLDLTLEDLHKMTDDNIKSRVFRQSSSLIYSLKNLIQTDNPIDYVNIQMHIHNLLM